MGECMLRIRDYLHIYYDHKAGARVGEHFVACGKRLHTAYVNSRFRQTQDLRSIASRTYCPDKCQKEPTRLCRYIHPTKATA